eukprot:3399498-Rhodomonas_salina.2
MCRSGPVLYRLVYYRIGTSATLPRGTLCVPCAQVHSTLPRPVLCPVCTRYPHQIRMPAVPAGSLDSFSATEGKEEAGRLRSNPYLTP